MEGYYLAETRHYNLAPEKSEKLDSLKGASWCRKCPDNCACTRAEDGTTFTDLHIMN